MMQLRLARSASRLAPSFGTRFASTLDPSSGLKYDPEKGPKGAYIPADPRKPSDSAKTLFKKCVAWGLREQKAARAAQQSNSTFSHGTQGILSALTLYKATAA
ncbi:hypothetical protein QBZ16_000910 [Prototheca wickerhamii]|uniref:Uncharacterized protein n=1 Tax=Prototheca wickerhamii TaxID=3111 RepID=A0AAD9IGV6_PROWI|nr:hypothetical protein QBZ16_000910 [Prototheca wickerhamii]